MCMWGCPPLQEEPAAGVAPPSAHEATWLLHRHGLHTVVLPPCPIESERPATCALEALSFPPPAPATRPPLVPHARESFHSGPT